MNLQGRPTNAGPNDIVHEEDYVDLIRVSKAPDEAYIQTLEQQQLAVRNLTHGFQFDTSWTYEDICFFLELHFEYLFRYFKEGPETRHYVANTPFLVVHKSHQTMTAVSYEPASLNGGVIKRNCMLQKKGFRDMKLFFGMFSYALSLVATTLLSYHFVTVTRHVVPLAVLASWSRSCFITLPPPTGQTSGGSSRSGKRKRVPTTPPTSDEEVRILEDSRIEAHSPPNKRVTTRGVFVFLGCSYSSLNKHCYLATGDASRQTRGRSWSVATDLNTIDTHSSVDMNADKSTGEACQWEEYDPANFGPDIPVAGASSSSTYASTSTQGPGISISGSEQTPNSSRREHTLPLLDIADVLDPLAPQQSFSELNINRSVENPYDTDLDIAFDF